MTPEKFKRKLTAILSADVKGYSRLMGEDEEGTIHTLNVYMGVIAGFVQQHRGRVVATGGDSVLAEFASVVDAVRCAPCVARYSQGLVRGTARARPRSQSLPGRCERGSELEAKEIGGLPEPGE
jgi:class 3 adenylate cyclase